MFSFHLHKEGIIVKHSLDNGDADTMIVQLALEKAKESDVVVHSTDTDIFIALIYHYDISDKSIKMTTNKGLCEIKNLFVVLNEDLRRCLLIADAMFGCDKVSATFVYLYFCCPTRRRFLYSTIWKCRKKMQNHSIKSERLCIIYLSMYQSNECLRIAARFIFTCFVFIYKLIHGSI